MLRKQTVLGHSLSIAKWLPVDHLPPASCPVSDVIIQVLANGADVVIPA